MIINEKKNINNTLIVDISDEFYVNNIYAELILNALSKRIFSIFKILYYFITNNTKFRHYIFNDNASLLSSIPIKPHIKEFIKTWNRSGGEVIVVSPLNSRSLEKTSLGFLYHQHLSFNDINTESQIKKKYSNKNFYTISKNISNKFNSFKFLSLDNKNVNKFSSYLIQLRPKQWVKNLLVFTPLFLLNKFELTVFINCLWAFVIFSYFASCIYIFNDLLDLNSDRGNNLKQFRPLASGNVSLIFFISALPIMLFFGLVFTYLFFAELLPLIYAYIFISLSYSMYFKKKVLVDIIILSGLYTLRLLVGAKAALMTVSFWILAFSIFIFLALASIKRFSEKSYIKNIQMNNLSRRGYAKEDIKILEQIGLISSFAACIVFALYVNTTEISNLIINIQSLWFICIVILYWLLRLNLVARRKDFFGDPLEFALNDKVSYLCLILVAFFYINGTINFITFN